MKANGKRFPTPPDPVGPLLPPWAFPFKQGNGRKP